MSNSSSIIAVHGLNLTASDQHYRETWSIGTTLWLKDFFPNVLPYARIFLFKYNADSRKIITLATMNDHATLLLEASMSKRANAQNRPLVYLAHSTGGLVVKKVGRDALIMYGKAHPNLGQRTSYVEQGHRLLSRPI